MPAFRNSRPVFVPSGISSFFEICDTNPDGSRITDPLLIGARGGGFIIQKGNTTTASLRNSLKTDQIVINEKPALEARTSLRVIQLLRETYEIPYVRISHRIGPPIGSGFGTSGAGAVGTAISVSDLFDLHLTLAEASAFAHTAEIQSVTGLGTVISLVSGTGAIGLVTEPGCFSVGHVDALLADHDEFTVVCACFGPIEKSSVLKENAKKARVNEFGRMTLEAIRDEGTPEALLKHSRVFAEKTGLASPELLSLADKAVKLGGIGATQNMIGNAVHCLVPNSKLTRFKESFGKMVPKNLLFESKLFQGGPKFI